MRSFRKGLAKSATLVAIGGRSRPGWSPVLGRAGLAAPLWTVGTSIALRCSSLEDRHKASRKWQVGLDLVAALSMSAALAFGVPLAGNVVALMYAGGQFLEKSGVAACASRDDSASKRSKPTCAAQMAAK